MVHRLVAELVVPDDEGVESAALTLLPDALADVQETSVLEENHRQHRTLKPETLNLIKPQQMH